MKYVCPICGYVYDEAKEKTPFAELPESWVCPLCGAAKSVFTSEANDGAKSISSPAAFELHDDMRELSAGELAAICSNLARGCEKQYKDEEAALFRQLADYFTAAVPNIPGAGTEELASKVQNDLNEGYPALHSAAVSESDRGTQRICVWGEKVTNIVNSLLSRYRTEGTAFLKNTKVWVCSICGFIYVGDTPPEICPVCKVPAWKFDEIEGRVNA